MEKGQKCQLVIGDMSTEGQGIGRVDGMAIFVEGAIPGDTVIAEISKVKKNYAFAVAKEIIEPSPYRIEAECKYAGQCGGCTYSGMSYEGQLRVKENQVREKLMRLGGLEEPALSPIVGMDNPYYYRNKCQMPISTGGIITRKGGIVENLGDCAIGFYKAKSHDVVNCSKCLLQAPPAEAVAEALRVFMRSDNITAYDPKWEKGLMRHLVVKTAVGTGEVMVILVINGKGIPNSTKLVEMLDEAVNELPKTAEGIEYSLESVVINVNKGKSSEIMGKECLNIAGKPTILERVGDMEFEISPLAFYQVNPVQMQVLYDKVLEYAGLTGDEIILDLYCGVGTIGLYCANEMRKKFSGGKGKVIGIESVKSAVLDANRNAVINGLVNAEFVYGRVEEVLPGLVNGEKWQELQSAKVASLASSEAASSKMSVAEAEAITENASKSANNGKAINAADQNMADILVEATEVSSEGKNLAEDEIVLDNGSGMYSIADKGPIIPNIVILDPPRSGCDHETLRTVAEAKPDKIVYVSCDPATLARDVKVLGELGYGFVEGTPVDMFPWTRHVEVVCLLQRIER